MCRLIGERGLDARQQGSKHCSDDGRAQARSLSNAQCRTKKKRVREVRIFFRGTRAKGVLALQHRKGRTADQRHSDLLQGDAAAMMELPGSKSFEVVENGAHGGDSTCAVLGTSTLDPCWHESARRTAHVDVRIAEAHQQDIL